MVTPQQPAKKSPAVCSMAIGATMAMTISIAVALALLPTPNHAFTPVRPHNSNVESPIRINPESNKVVLGRKFALSARDTIFSLKHDDGNDDKDDDKDDGGIDISDLITANETPGSSGGAEESKKKKIGDPLREDNGVRASIHPTSINAIADALKARATESIKVKGQKKETDDGEEEEDDMMYFRATETVEPLMVMITAGQFASDAIQKRQESSEADGMLMNQEEEQTLAGRIMGVIMRLDMLEEELAERVSSVEWIGKYDEWGNFGVLSDEHQNNLARDSDNDNESSSSSDDDGLAAVHAKILEDPLFCMNRAECLLAIFLQQVEIPQLKKIGEAVPDGSKIDFLDQDRLEVVVGNVSS